MQSWRSMQYLNRSSENVKNDTIENRVRYYMEILNNYAKEYSIEQHKRKPCLSIPSCVIKEDESLNGVRSCQE